MTPEQEKIYEDGFLAGQEQLIKSSVHRAVNRMAQRPWVGLTGEDFSAIKFPVEMRFPAEFRAGARWAEAKLKEKNT